MPVTDALGRVMRYLRVSVTDQCNLRCDYCRPAGASQRSGRGHPLTLEEMARLCRLFVALGIDRIRLTGGEPLLRRNLVWLVREVSALSGLTDLSLTTNGVLLARHADDLCRAGLQRVNISLDTLDPALYARITRGGELSRVLSGIDAAVRVGLKPVKINMVVMRGINDHEIPEMIAFAERYGLVPRLIEIMPVGSVGLAGSVGRCGEERHLSADEMVARARLGDGREWMPVAHPGAKGAGPARYFRIAGSAMEVGLIAARSRHFCDSCNRMRLTAHGVLVSCLGERERVDLKTPLRDGATDQTLMDWIRTGVSRKPRGHHFEQGAAGASGWEMSGLGG
ncbi:MAG: GTP 3',8-cyclase MoaA [Magnetococcales bacterium]|nr:GTP 3',8-cyclase MoaA [Magnetococcales bacterium]